MEKSQWPLVRTPYLTPSWMMLIGFCLTPLPGIGRTLFSLGLLAWIYAYRKQTPHRAAEKKWWHEFRAHSRCAADGIY